MVNNATTSENKTDFVYVKVKRIAWLKGHPPRDTFSHERITEENEDSKSLAIFLCACVLRVYHWITV